MKLPRWLLVSLIAVSSVALLAFPAWLWVEMPRWTAQRFVAAIEAGDMEQANQRLANASFEGDLKLLSIGCGDLKASLAHPKVLHRSRTALDLICGSQRTEICGNDIIFQNVMPRVNPIGKPDDSVRRSGFDAVEGIIIGDLANSERIR